MKNKLRSIFAAATLLTAGACSETGLSVAPERQTLPAPEIELTSISARSCIVEMFRALANPELFCPHPLEGDDISEEDATGAQNMYDQCLIEIPKMESIMSAEVITLFTPFLPQDFDFTGSIPEVQERIAEEDIPLTISSNYQTTDYVNNFSYTFAELTITPGFIEEADLSVAYEFHNMLIHNNIAYMKFSSSKNQYTDEVVTRNSSFRSIPSNYLERVGLGGYITPVLNFMLRDRVGTSDDFVNIYGSLEEQLYYDSFASNTSIHMAIATSIGECVEDAVYRVTGGMGFTVSHVE